MQFLYNNIVVFHVFAVCAVFAWLFGGTRGDYLLPVMPWVTALLVEVMVCFPQHHDGETTYEARERVWEAMRKDPLVWLSLGFILLLLVPFLNVFDLLEFVKIGKGKLKEFLAIVVILSIGSL